MGTAEQQRAGFSLRLCNTLYGAGWKNLSPTRLTKEFNWLAGESSVSLHSARKWLAGGAIPTQARIVVLANWLDVNAEWLRFGTQSALRTPTQFDSQDSKLLAGVSHLTKIQKQLARDMMKMLVLVGSK